MTNFLFFRFWILGMIFWLTSVALFKDCTTASAITKEMSLIFLSNFSSSRLNCFSILELIKFFNLASSFFVDSSLCLVSWIHRIRAFSATELQSIPTCAAIFPSTWSCNQDIGRELYSELLTIASPYPVFFFSTQDICNSFIKIIFYF